MKYILVTTISSFRMRYVVELHDEEPSEYALDYVTMEEAKEFSQEHMGEYIVDSWEIPREDIMQLVKDEVPYLSGWTEDRVFDVLVTSTEDKPA